jgi:hypothetical protein
VANRRENTRTFRRSPVVLLEQPDMEDVMEAGALWQLELVRDVAHALEYLERPIELGPQFPTVDDV